MEHRIIWVHGIGVHSSGYSAPWEAAYNAYLHLDHACYLEVCWDTVFGAPSRETERGVYAMPIELTAEERLVEREVRRNLAAILTARVWALADATEPRPTRGLGGALEWSQLAEAQTGERGFLPDWLLHPDAYLGDFTKYLASQRIRTAVKERFKEQLRPLAGHERVSVIAHSWGTVVAYEGLIDLESEAVGPRVANLFTLGSPLWLVRPLLTDASGRKPENAARWVNIHARGDLVGSWLSPNFTVDKDFQVLSFGPDAHGSYLVEGNEAVQNDLVAHMILETPLTRRRNRASLPS